MSQSLIEKIKNAELVEGQRVVATYLVQNLHKTAFLSGPEVAQECNVSLSTITRMAQKLGYPGFPEFKRDLEQLYRKQTTPLEVFESFLEKSQSQSVTQMTMAQDLDNIRIMQNMLVEDNLEKVLKILANSDTLYLAAIGLSEILVDQLASLLEVLGKKVVKLKSFGITKKAELIEFNRNDVLISFSFQKVVKEVRDLTIMAKNKHMKTIAITDSEANPLSLVSDFTLVTPVTETTFSMSLVSPMVMINILSNGLINLDKKANMKKLQSVKRTWENHPIFCD